MLRYSLGHLEDWKRIKEHARNGKMDKKRMKVALVVLDAVKSRFPETEKFTDDTNVKKKKSLQMRSVFTSLEAKN